MSKSFSVPQAVRKEAQRGLDLRKEYGRGGLSTQEAGDLGIGSGVQRAADLVEGSVTYDTVRRMLSFFNRHRAYKKYHDRQPPSNSLISWLLWGGDAGYRWAKKIVAQEENVKKGTFQALVLGIEDDMEDEPVEAPSTFQELLLQAQITKANHDACVSEIPVEEGDDEEDQDEVETWDEISYCPMIDVPEQIRTYLKKALQYRRKTGQGTSEAKRVAQSLHRQQYAQLDLDVVERLLDGLGADDPEEQVNAMLAGGHWMLYALSKAEPHVPEKYLEGLTGEARKKRKKQIQDRIKGKQSYKPLEGDEDVKTKPSKYTKTKLAAAVREEMKTSGKKEFLRAATKVSGAPRRILEQVYDRGMKAWSTSGHRVGATAQQWAIARVYSFLTGGKTTRTADRDLHQEWKK